MKSGSEAWAVFWRNEPEAASGATLANLPPPLQESLDAPWHEFARLLPPKAKVLDLATGGGIVLDLLRRARRDLDLMGVDTAANLPKRAGITLKSGVSTERLPFADGRFGAVTSRFGIEYGDLEAGAVEAARVLRSGGRLCMLIHHDASNVVRHNRARQEALHWAARESGWIEKALSVAGARKAYPLPTPPTFAAAATEAAKRFPDQSAAWEFLTGLNQLLETGALESRILELRARADGEIARIDTLLVAACDQARMDRLTGELTSAGVLFEPAGTIDEPGGSPLAWHLTGRKL